MTVILFDNDESESQSNLVTWQTKLEKSGELDSEGDFMVWTYCELAGTVTNRAVAGRVLLDGVERGSKTFIPTLANEYDSFSCMGLIHLSVGLHVLTLQYVTSQAAQTVKIRRARVLLMKH